MSLFDKQHQNLFCSLLMASLILFSPVTALAKSDISRQHVIDIVNQEFGGKVLKVKKKDGFYNVKLLTKGGTVKQVRVDGRSGKILKRKK